jgi:hypothetical protein
VGNKVKPNTSSKQALPSETELFFWFLFEARKSNAKRVKQNNPYLLGYFLYPNSEMILWYN